MKIKRIGALVLAMLLVLGMSACGVSKEQVTGVWQREPLYMAHYGCYTEMVVSFAEDGSFSALLLAQESHNLLNYAGGTWSLDGKTIVANRTDGGTGTMEFTYNSANDTVSFEGYEFTRSE